MQFPLLFINFLCCLILVNTSRAQQLEPLPLHFTYNNRVLKNPMTGGFTTPQVSKADFNQDGIQDLFIFDRNGNVSVTFLGDGSGDAFPYTYAPKYRDNFPAIQNWALLRDYNGDGIKDLFFSASTPGISGVEVMTGYYEDEELKFEPFRFYDFLNNVIPFRQNNGSYTNIYVSDQDLPAIDDIDLDGDLDIVSFGVNGGYMEYFTNQSIENGFGKDSLIFIRNTDCFGGVFESGLSTCLCLPEEEGACCEGDGGPPGIAVPRHAGSTILSLDEDGDGDKDFILGDISFSTITLLENGGTDNNVFFIDQDCTYPSNSIPVDVPSFPATFYEDWNNDGIRDLLAAPNSPRRVEDYDNLWYYQNNGTEQAPDFVYQTQNALTASTLDMGSGSSPVFVDFDQDGLMDIIVGTNTFYQPFGERDPRLFAYRNIGTASQPAFQLVDEDYLNFSNYASNAWAFVPTFGDLDGDGDLDLLVGYQGGGLFYGENIAGAGNPFEFTITPDYLGIDVGQNSAPTLVDMDRDGDLDMVIGEKNGNLNYMPNLGSATNPLFQPVHTGAPNNEFFGEVDTSPFGFDIGMSAPIFIDFEGEYRLFSGSYLGAIYEYGNIENNLEGAFELLNDNYGTNVLVGEESRPAFFDINNNGILDMLIGNFRGGLQAYITDRNIDGSVGIENGLSTETFLNIYPNPAQSYFKINTIRDQILQLDILVYDVQGRQLFARENYTPDTPIFTHDWTAGIYYCKIKSNKSTIVQKVLVQH